MHVYAMVWVSVVLSALAQVFLKHGMNRINRRNAAARSCRSIVVAVLCEPWVWCWGVSFVIATGLWLISVRSLDLSYAFPLLSVGYILVNLMSTVFFKERVDGVRWLAVAVISAGVILIART